MSRWQFNRGRPEEGLREAFQCADQESGADQARVVLDAIVGFLDQCEDAVVRAGAAVFQPRLAVAAVRLPDEAVRVLCRVVGRCGPDGGTMTAVLRAWARQPNEADFAATWAAASRALGTSDTSGWFRLLDQVLRPMPRSDISPAFRRLAIASLIEVVDARFDHYALSASPIWQVMYVLGPDTRAVWFCLLGDHAAERGAVPAAVERYQLALKKGCEPARARLARLRAIDGYRRLRGGDATMAEKEFDAALALVDEPDYQALRVAATLARGTSPTLALTELAKRVAGTTLPTTLAFVKAWAQVHAFDAAGAQATLRGLVVTAPPALDRSDLLANARLLLGVLAADDELVVRGARQLVEHHGDQWTTLSIVDSEVILAAVARRDARLFCALEGPAATMLRATAGRRALLDATRAALAGRAGEAHELLAIARRLTESDGEQAEVITRLSQQVARLGQLSDEIAYAALRRDDVVQPWTERAVRIWEATEDGASRTHHLAVAQHAHAYDLELAGDDAAFTAWGEALRYWSRLQGEETWWDRKATHLVGVLPDATEAEVEEAVDELRQELPTHLVEPHQALADHFHERDPRRARAHMDLVRMSTPVLPRTRLQPALSAIVDLVDDGCFDRALADLEPRLKVDPASREMAMLALEIGRRWSEDTYGARVGGAGWSIEDWNRWTVRAELFLGRIRLLVDPACDELGLTPQRFDGVVPHAPGMEYFVRELAMYECWWGACMYHRARITRSALRYDASIEALQLAVTHLRLATMLTKSQPEHEINDSYRRTCERLLAAAIRSEADFREVENDPYVDLYRFGLR